MTKGMINPKLLTSEVLGSILASVPEQRRWERVFNPHQSELQLEKPKIGEFIADQLCQKFPKRKYVKGTAAFIRIAAVKGLISVEARCSGLDASLHPSINPEIDLDVLARECGFKVFHPRRKSKSN